MSYQKKQVVSWQKLEADCHKLAKKLLKSAFDFQRALVVTRGGLCVGGLVARALDIKKIETIGLESYHAQHKSDVVQVLKQASPEYLRQTLVLDDLVDSGDTYRFLRLKTEKCLFATLYAKPAGRDAVDIYVEDFAQDCWVEFPWETFENND